MLAHEVSLAVAGDALAVAWHGNEGGRDAIWLQPLDGRDRAHGAPLRLTDGSNEAFEPDLQFVEGDAVVAWYEKTGAGAFQAWLGRFDAEGRPQWRQALSPPGRQGRNPVVRAGVGGLRVAWLESGPDGTEVHSALYDPGGTRRDDARVVGKASDDTWNLNAALEADGGFLIAWDAGTGTRAKELRLATVTATAAVEAQLGGDDGHESTYPDIALAGDRVAVVWSDTRDGNQEIYLAVGSLDELRQDLEARARRVTQTAGASYAAYAAWNGPRLMLAWCDDSSGQLEINRQEFTAQGTPVGPIEQVTHTSTDSLVPSIRAAGTGFALAWTEREARREPDASGHNPTVTSRVHVLRTH